MKKAILKEAFFLLLPHQTKIRSSSTWNSSYKGACPVPARGTDGRHNPRSVGFYGLLCIGNLGPVVRPPSLDPEVPASRNSRFPG